MQQYLRIFLIGIIILVGAIIINVLASLLGLQTWFSFIELTTNKGLNSAFKEVGFVSLLYLFVVYPFVLGFLGYLGNKWVL
jgi:hypothetical protein